MTATRDSQDGGSGAESVPARIAQILDMIRPSIQNDGGDIELVEVTDKGVVRIRLHGACVGCPSSSMTLRIAIEQNLKENIPEVAGVEAVV